MDSKTLKQRALNNLQGCWGVSVAVALVALLLGGLNNSVARRLFSRVIRCLQAEPLSPS